MLKNGRNCVEKTQKKAEFFLKKKIKLILTCFLAFDSSEALLKFLALEFWFSPANPATATSASMPGGIPSFAGGTENPFALPSADVDTSDWLSLLRWSTGLLNFRILLDFSN